MKNKLLLIIVIAMVIFQQKAIAQLPEISTADKPSWYYIQVVGNGSSREDRVFSAENGYLYGKTLSKTSDAQLFRFEKSGNNYFIISKSANKKVDVAMKDSEECLSLSDAGIGFTLDPLAINYFNITATKTPTNGDTSKKWAHQSNDNSDYKIILVNTSWSSGENSQFSFIPYEEINLEYSTEAKSIWYSINSSVKGSENECITDASSLEGSDIKIAVESFVQGNDNQLWKLVSKGSRVNFVNKATGNTIQNQSDVVENNIMYNFTQVTPNENDNGGWTLKHIRIGQYSIAGAEEDDITRYLSSATEGQAPAFYDAENLLFSNTAWKLKKVDTSITSIPEFQEKEGYRVYSAERRIIVEGADDYVIRTIQGVTVNKNGELPVGVYLVTVDGQTTKLLVK